MAGEGPSPLVKAPGWRGSDTEGRGGESQAHGQERPRKAEAAAGAGSPLTVG